MKRCGMRPELLGLCCLLLVACETKAPPLGNRSGGPPAFAASDRAERDARAAAARGRGMPAGWDVPASEAPKPPAEKQEKVILVQIDRHIGFDELSDRFAAARKEKKKLVTGHVELHQMYHLMTVLRLHDAESFDERVAELKKWRETRNEDPAPLIALARLYVHSAWEERGSGFAFTVTAEGGRLFLERLKEAASFAVEAEKLELQDPELFCVQIDIAKGLGLPRAVVDKCVEQGSRIDPTYFPLYRAASEYLLPRWHGNQGDPEKFAEQIKERLGGDDGLEAYGRIANDLSRYDPFLAYDGGFSASDLAAAVHVLLKRYPKSQSYLDFAAIVMWKERDRELSRKLGDLIDLKQPDLVHWVERARYDAFRTWTLAHEPADRPDALIWADMYPLDDLAVSASGSQVVTAGPAPPGVKIWDLENPGPPRGLRGAGEDSGSLKMDAAGRFLIAYSRLSGSLVWDQKEPGEPTKLPDSVRAISDDGNLAASVDDDGIMAAILAGNLEATPDKDGRIRFWDPSSGDEVRSFPVEGRVGSVRFSSDGKRIVASFHSAWKIFDAVSGETTMSVSRTATIDGKQWSLVNLAGFLPDGSVLGNGWIKSGAVRSAALIRWQPENGELSEFAKLSTVLPAIENSPSKLVAVADQEQKGLCRSLVHVFRTDDGALVRTIHGHAGIVKQLSLAANGSVLATAEENGPVHVWKLASINP